MMRKSFAVIAALVAILAFSVSAMAFKMNAELPVKFAVAQATIANMVGATFTEGVPVGNWKSVETSIPRDKAAVILRLVYDGEKLACVQTEYAISMNDFMTYDWYSYGDDHGMVLNAATGVSAEKLATAYNKLMDEVYGKIMGQYRGEIYYMLVDGVLAGVRLKTGQGGVLNIYYYLNEPMLNDDGTPRTDLRFFELKQQ